MIHLPGYFDNYTNRKDKSVSLKFITQELTPEQVMQLHGFLDHFGYIVFKPENTLTAKEMDEIGKMHTEFHGKSLSQRLMAALWVFWDQGNTSFSKFEDFYKSWMETKIEKVKAQLD